MVNPQQSTGRPAGFPCGSFVLGQASEFQRLSALRRWRRPRAFVVASPERFGFDKDALDAWFLLANLLLEPINHPLELVERKIAPEPDVDGQQDLIGSELHGQDVADLLDSIICCDYLFHFHDLGAIRAFPDQQSPDFTSQNQSNARQQCADHDGANGIEVGIVEGVSQKDAEKRNDRTENSGGVFEKNDKDRGILAAFDLIPDVLVGVLAQQEFPVGNAPGVPFEACGEEQDRVVPEGMPGKRGMTEARDALVNGESSTNAEDVDRDEQRVKVQELAMAEGMESVRWPALRLIPISSRISLPESAVE